jgi:hypothetical protein
MTSPIHVQNIAETKDHRTIASTPLSDKRTLITAGVAYPNIHNLTLQFITT